jgi:hypothetical protein
MDIKDKNKNNLTMFETSKINIINEVNIERATKIQHKNGCCFCCKCCQNKCSSKILYLFILLITLSIGAIIFFAVRYIIKKHKDNDEYYSQNNFNLTISENESDDISTEQINLYNNNSKKIGIYLSNKENEIFTSLFLKYISKEDKFELFLLISLNVENDYPIPKNVYKIIINKNNSKENLKYEIIQNKIDILIYQDSIIDEINFLNNLKNIKTVFILNFCSFYWLYSDKYNYYKNLLSELKNSEYVVSSIPFDNDYVFRNLGINSSLVKYFNPYDSNITNIPYNSSSKQILMISNYEYKYNRIDLGIKSMKYIVEEIPDSKMIIVSNLNNKNLKILVKELELSNHIEFIDNTSNFELYLSNSSLHIFPSMVETFPLILSQTKIHGIPNIITGLDYIPLSKGGTVNVNDDEPETIAKEAIKILKDKDYRIKLSKEAKESMNDFKNELINKKWVELLLAIYEGKDSYNEIRMNQKRISEKEIIQILENQEKLMNIRDNEKRINLNDLLSLNFTS